MHSQPERMLGEELNAILEAQSLYKRWFRILPLTREATGLDLGGFKFRIS